MSGGGLSKVGAPVVVLMGVAGSGKTTVGRLVAEELEWDFLDADDLHSRENVERMRSGIPLTDIDREPWLAELRRSIERHGAERRPLVIACSALTRRFRQSLRQASSELIFVHLRVSHDLLRDRLARRQHFMSVSMLESQLAALESPGEGEAVTIDVDDELPLSVAGRVVRLVRSFSQS